MLGCSSWLDETKAGETNDGLRFAREPERGAEGSSSADNTEEGAVFDAEVDPMVSLTIPEFLSGP